MLSDLVKLMDKSYQSSNEEYNRSLTKYKLGLVSETDFEKIENNQLSAKVNLEIVKRNLANVKMNLNAMRGVEPTEDFDVEPYRELIINLNDASYYIEEALKNSDTIVNAQETVDYQEQRMNYIADFYSDNSNEYVINNLQIDAYELDVQEVKMSLEADIMSKYNLVKTKQDNYTMAVKEILDVNNQLERVMVNAKVGFVADYVVSDYYALIIQKNNEKATQLREYIQALEDLYSTSGLDFPY
jgi:outer membrane protein TolC